MAFQVRSPLPVPCRREGDASTAAWRCRSPQSVQDSAKRVCSVMYYITLLMRRVVGCTTWLDCRPHVFCPCRPVLSPSNHLDATAHRLHFPPLLVLYLQACIVPKQPPRCNHPQTAFPSIARFVSAGLYCPQATT